MKSHWKHFASSQDEWELAIMTSKDAQDIPTQLEKKRESPKAVIDIFNEKTHQEILYFAISDQTNMVIEENKVITKKSLAHNVSELASQLYWDVCSFKAMFANLIGQGIPSPWDGNGDSYLKENYSVLIMEDRNSEATLVIVRGELEGKTFF